MAARSATALAVAFAACLAAAPAPAGAQEITLAVSAGGGGVRADAAFSAGTSEAARDPAAVLRDGLESRISFTLRCYEHRVGIAGLLGDELLAERTVVRAAFYDIFDRRFVVEQDGRRTSYADEAGFLAAFFTLGGVEVLPAAGAARSAGRGAPGSRYVAARAQYDPVRLSPPLTILTLFGVAARHTTPWVRQDVPREPLAEARP